MNLEEEKRVYIRSDCITFRKTTEQFGGLSNMASGYPIVVNNTLIKSSEALYQALRYPHLPYVQSQIINESSPMTAKMISKKYHAQSRSDWEKIKIPIMKWVLRVKLSQNMETFGKLLLATDSKDIVEESKKDSFWGAKVIEDRLEGVNVLGRLLMELRTLYQKHDMNVVVSLKIDDFKLFNHQIVHVTAKDKENYKFNNGLLKGM